MCCLEAYERVHTGRGVQGRGGRVVRRGGGKGASCWELCCRCRPLDELPEDARGCGQCQVGMRVGAQRRTAPYVGLGA